MKTSDYAIELRNAFEYKRFVNLTTSLGKQLNDRKDRFDKSDILEQALEIYTDGRLKWVDDIGVDHIDTKYNLKLEMKFSENSLYTKTGKTKTLVKVKLKNSLGTNKGITIDHPANYYVIAQGNAMGIISWDDIKEFLFAVPDGIEAHIPFESLNIVFNGNDIDEPNTQDVNYKEEKMKAQRRLIESVV